jgi:hypothetical protein
MLIVSEIFKVDKGGWTMYTVEVYYPKYKHRPDAHSQ